MLRKLLASIIFACSLLVMGVSASLANDCSAIIEQGIVPTLPGLGVGPKPGVSALSQLQKMVKNYNKCNRSRNRSARESRLQKEVAVFEPNPILLPSWVRDGAKDIDAKTAAVGLCGAELQTCEDGKKLLNWATGQCSNVFLALIDVSSDPDFPRDFFESVDNKLILFAPRYRDDSFLERTNPPGFGTPDDVATVLCPTESDRF